MKDKGEEEEGVDGDDVAGKALATPPLTANLHAATSTQATVGMGASVVAAGR